MKKSILIFCAVLTILSLTAFGFFNRNDSLTNQVETLSSKSIASNLQVIEGPSNKVFPNFFYGVGTRFGPIKKGDLDKARSITDFLPKKRTQQIVSYKSVKVIILDDNKQTDINETGHSAILTASQINLLQSLDYSTNILIRADYLQRDRETNVLEDSYSTPHLTIVPEKQAEYVNGIDALVEYLKENSKENMGLVQESKLQPAKLYFTVTKKGSISNVRIVTSSGYSSIDKKMIDLMTKAPGKWEPAENLKGEKVDQELVFSYGLMGC